jgi:hypothetical protein
MVSALGASLPRTLIAGKLTLASVEKALNEIAAALGSNKK